MTIYVLKSANRNAKITLISFLVFSASPSTVTIQEVIILSRMKI